MAENRSIFTFKQFQIAHGDPGLKVNTESCLLGAIAGDYAQGKILDIGTGSGVLACMIAQKAKKSKIVAIEIHPEVAQLAKENFKQSRFSDQIELISIDLHEYNEQTDFDFIVCNPPFFSNHLPNSNISKQIAIHDEHLSPEALAKSLKNLLNKNGKAMVLYPPLNMQIFEQFLNQNKLFIQHEINVYSKPQTPILRKIAVISHKLVEKSLEEIAIKNENNAYSDSFKKLLQPYYLIFP
jgi:tRNA1Val (adenine37-N6)-methyltransferase